MIQYLVELNELGISYKFEGGDNEVKLRCPFHDDNVASLGLNVKSGVFHCFACEAKGHFVNYLAKMSNRTSSEVATYLAAKYKLSDEGSLAINPSRIEEYHSAIWDAKPLLQELYSRAVSDETIRKYRIGYAATGFGKGRITIPIQNPSGEFVNIQYYLPGAETRKFLSLQNRNKPRLFPHHQIVDYDTVALVAGQIKALAALQVLNASGIGAISPSSSGEGKWHPSLTPFFENKNVIIIMDVDAAGRKASQKLAKLLYQVVASLKVVELEFPAELRERYPKGGVDDFIAIGGDLLAVINATPSWSPPSITRLADEEPTDVGFNEAFDPANVGKRLKLPVVVSGVGETPFFLPEVFEIHCSRDAGDCCALCPVFASKSTDPFAVSLNCESPNYLKMLDAPSRIQHGALSAEAGIPHECKKHSCKVTKHLRAEEITISPIMDLQAVEDDQRAHQFCLLITANVEANSSYDLIGRMFPHPLTQRAVFIASKATATSDDLSKWSLTNGDRLLDFRPEEWTVEGIHKKLQSIYNYMSCSVTKVYEKMSTHLVADLTFHSVLFLPFFGDIEKGWVESLILGDSAQGKTKIVERLSKFYNLGLRMDCKNATTAGLIGGFIPLGSTKRLFVQWGVMVKADRKLFILEEVKGISTDVIGRLTEARSSGVAQLVKVETKSEKCRARGIWVSNARSDRPLSTYSFGVEAAKELIGAPEDLRRFDIVFCQQPLIDYDARPREPERYYDASAFRDCVLFAWTRKPEQVVFESEEYLLNQANLLTSKYVEHGMPLLDKGWTNLKVARLAAALAARTYSVQDGDTLFVRNCHVEYIRLFLDSVYAHPASGYYNYSRAVKLNSELVNPTEVQNAIESMAYPKALVENIVLKDFIETRDIEDWAGCPYEQAQNFISMLVRNRAIVRRSGRGRYSGYTKTQGFVEFLRTIDVQAYDKRPEYLNKPVSF